MSVVSRNFLVGLNVNFILNDHFWRIFSSNIHSFDHIPAQTITLLSQSFENGGYCMKSADSNTKGGQQHR